jgi:hypothetical protein
MKKYITAIIFLLICSCSRFPKFDQAFNEHQFDTSVMNNLNTYDAIRKLVIKKMDSFHFGDSPYDFTFYYNFDSTTAIRGHENTGIPKEIYSEIVLLFNKLGKTNIFGFILSKDSTFTVLIRNTHLTKYYLDVRERLYWFSNTSRITKQSFPVKDTLLTDKWQYEIYYDKRSEF